jgi:hypothetical protein
MFPSARVSTVPVSPAGLTEAFGTEVEPDCRVEDVGWLAEVCLCSSEETRASSGAPSAALTIPSTLLDEFLYR